ncbi:3'-kinase, partial [Deinococcus sp. 23YEL01]|nr:3'-kinase [Deinococcus sp. 23YEL01]
MRRWHLTPDGEARRTPSSDLQPVVWQGLPAMLKVARSAEEQRGNDLMVWLEGEGAARAYRHEGAALLLERLESAPDLAALALDGQDDAATRILCSA